MACKDFHHPFEPYDIQQQFMEAVYSCIDDGKVGIFESPTGTGKSLSLICGALTWLREYKRRAFEEAVATVQLDDDEPGWMVEHAKEDRQKEALRMQAEFETRLDAVRQREQKIKERATNGEPPLKRRKQTDDETLDAAADEEHFLLDDYDSDDESHERRGNEGDYSSDTTKLMQKLGMLRNDKEDDSAMDDSDHLKIYFCSRTHSQLSQLAGELRRVKLPPSLPSRAKEMQPFEELKHVTLGSRKNLCINPKVNRLTSQTAINERCMELQQTNTSADHKCPYLPNKQSANVVLDFRDHALAKIRDIEDLATVGEKLQICPYYASRSVIGPSEIATLPYPLLLQKSAREALGISLRGHVVIIDEAHNLINAVEGTYSVKITEEQLARSRESLMEYLRKFRARLKGSNRLYVTQVVRMLDSLLLFFATLKDKVEPGGAVRPQELLSGKAVDQINLSKLVCYINDSKLARKVEAYAKHLTESQYDHSARTLEPPTLTHVQNFLMTLMNPSKEGRFLWSKEQGTSVLRYLLLDPSEHFRDIVESARAVILAGGTMSPMDEYKQQLFPYLPVVRTLCCGHLIPPSNLLVRTISADRDGLLEFDFKARSNPTTAIRLGRTLLELAPKVKGGFIVFFPSYGYLDQVSSCWRQESLLQRLHALKPVFSDSRTGSSDDIFKAYSEATKSDGDGAILLSVIGGKLSEGINFSDHLGRCVLVVGLPFPNLETPEWKAKMQYIDEKAVARGEPRGKASREHVENVCMRSVNQAIGRVIRHKNDWASILLMDNRYVQERIKGKLPGWIKESLPSRDSPALSDLVEVSRSVESFMRSR